MRNVFLFLLLAFLISACDSDGNNGTNATGETGREKEDHSEWNTDIPEDSVEVPTADTLVVQSATNLPSCDDSRKGESFFVEEKQMPFFCFNGVWRNADDSTDFSIVFNDGFLVATEKNVNDEVVCDSLDCPSPRSIHGVLQKGPFFFGTKVTVENTDSVNFYRVSSDNRYKNVFLALKNNGAYRLNAYLKSDVVKVTAEGRFRNELTNKVSNSVIKLSAISSLVDRDSVNVNVLTHLEAPRIEQLSMNHVDFLEAKRQAELEVLTAFGIEPSLLYSQNNFDGGVAKTLLAEDFNISGNSEASAALLAISILLQSADGENNLENLLNNIAEDIKGDGVWNDPNWKIKIADGVVALDSNWKYNDIRNNLSAWGFAVPNFEKYVRAFIPMAYGFEPCTGSNAGEVTFVSNGQSVYFANDYGHVDHSKVRFICDANTNQWRVANAIEKDTVGFGRGLYDKEVREGQINFDTYYIFENATNAWRVATPQEADGFTDIAEVYAGLKTNEKVVFIIRHSERTDDISEKGHLTENGKKYAFELGKRLKGESFYYGYSGFTRTKETCENIALGKGETKYSLDVLDGLNGDWYVKNAKKLEQYKKSDGGGWVVFSKYAFLNSYQDAFYDLESRSKQLLNNEILKNLTGMKRVSVLCTHDQLVVPLLAYVTDGHANLRYYSTRRWLNYLSGVAMIISPDGSVRYVPVKGLDTGTM